MHDLSPHYLVELLRSQELRLRTGVLLLPPESLGTESEIAVNLAVSHQDICIKIISQAQPSKKLLGINKKFIFDQLDSIINESGLSGSCILVSGVDILLAAIKNEEVLHFWNFFRCNYRRGRGLIISLPVNAKSLMPLEEYNRWVEIQRVAVLKGT